MDFLEHVVLGEIKRLIKFACHYEDDFVKAVMGSNQQNVALDHKLKEKELAALQVRDGGYIYIATVRKYTRARTLTPRMLNELIEHIEVHQAEKNDGIWEQHLVIHYNCVGAIFIPGVFPLPAPQVSVNTRKGVVVNYAPNQLAV